MTRTHHATWLLTGTLALTAGCVSTWRPALEPRPNPQESAKVELAAYLPQATPGRQVYLRRDPRLRSEPVTWYARQVETTRQLDGVFVDREVGELTAYVAGPGQEEPLRYFDWTLGGEERKVGFFLEFDPPLVYLPPTLPATGATEGRYALRVFDRWGHRLRTGTVKRTVRLEGHEDVAADGVRFEACLRVVADTSIRVNWGPWVEVTEYLWLARGIGEVKRIDVIQALVFPFYFHEAFAYELAAAQDRAEGVAGAPASRPPAWARMVVMLDRFLPRLRVGGAVVEYAAQNPEGATVSPQGGAP
jgi:hypothetical protein